MFNLNYLKYLFLSKKYFLFFISLLVLLDVVIIDNKTESMIFLCIIIICLTYFLPCTIFSYLHDKKAIDSYFSLPLSRQELLNTALLFIAGVITILFSFAYLLLTVINNCFGLETILNNFIFLLGFLSLAAFNTLLYQIGNSVLDGITMIGAYSFLPLSVYLVLGSFFDSYVYGFDAVNLNFEVYFSPIYLAIANLINLTTDAGNLNIGYLVALIIILVTSIVLLNYFFVRRKVERAESLSKQIMAYPLVINLYALICLLVIACGFNYTYASILDYLSEYALAFIVVFAMYICAYFVYKRSFSFDYRRILLFLGLLIVSLGFAGMAKSCNGFGLAYQYNKENINRCEIAIYNPSDDLYSSLAKDDTYLYIEITLGVDPTKEIPATIMTMIEEKRNESIESYYEGHEYLYGETIDIYNNYHFIGDWMAYDDYYYYSKDVDFTYDDLLKIAASDNCEVMISNDNETFKLMAQ